VSFLNGHLREVEKPANQVIYIVISTSVTVKIMDKIGVLRFLRRYPVKGMMGEDLENATVSSSGLEGDRVYAFVDEDSPNLKFPWMTARQRHEMILFKPKFLGETNNLRKVEVLTPEGARFQLPNPEFQEYLQKRFQYRLRLEYSEAGIKDSRPVSLLGLQTLEALKRELGLESLRRERFRENFYVEWDNRSPYFENELVGRTIMIGQVSIKIDKKNGRCAVPTLDPGNAISSPEILELIKNNHDGCFGVYGIPTIEGTVSVGEDVFLV
jgi:uncharacterized protein YcbX